MPAERYFIKSDLTPGGSLSLEGQEFHHLAHVMRTKVGETIEIVNGTGALAQARLDRLSKHEAILYTESVAQTSPPSFELILAQALPRLNRLDFILEKATELGVTQIWLFPGALSERKELTQSQGERLESVTIAAMKQCGRLYLPQIISQPVLDKWKTPAHPLFFGDLEAQAPLFEKAWKTHQPQSGALFATGPESGFTEKEIACLRQLQGIGVKLHDSVLRTDTASIVALGLMAHWLCSHQRTTPL